MTKFILVMYMCSMISGECPNHHIPGFTFTSHYDCVQTGYRAAHGTFKGLEETEAFDKEYIENNKIVVKFECREIEVSTPIIPPKKPKIPV